MRHARHILAITLIASALCADRAVASVSSPSRAESARIVTLAERFAKRFSSRELRQVSAVLRFQQVTERTVGSSSSVWTVTDCVHFSTTWLTAPQLPLPPPLA